jgi:multiple sugar transport system substrate-binding protein
MITALLLTFCLSGAAFADNATKGKLSIWLGWSGTEDAIKAAEKAFKKQYPNVNVELLTFSLRDFETKLAIAMPTGNGPDVMILHDFLLPRYIESNSMDAVPENLVKFTYNEDIIAKPYAVIVTRKGKPVAVPWWTGRNGLFYNLDHFKEAGLTDPPTTVKQMWEYAEKLVRKGPDGKLNRAGLTMRLSGSAGVTQKFGYLYYQAVGEQMLETGKKPGLVRVTLKDNIDVAAKVLLDRVTHLHGPKKVDDWALKHDAQGFASGAAAMLMRESWVIPYVKKNGPNVNFGVTAMPRGDKFWGAFNFIVALAVNKDSRMKKAAWDFIRAMQTKEALDSILLKSGWIPLRKDVDYSNILKKEPRIDAFLKTPAGYNQYLEPPNTAYIEVTTRVGDIISAAYRDASLVNNLEGAKKVIKKMHKGAEEILRDYDIYTE